jgi:hypothetical protein
MKRLILVLLAAAGLFAQPKGAIVLFDGKNLDAWKLPEEGDPHWKIVDGVLQVDPGNPHTDRVKCRLATRENFGDVKLHVEFWLPLMPDKQGQARANSGVFLAGRYEVQILDTYGHPPEINGAGSLYEVAAPLVNASKPPEQWQTYDIAFRTARFQGDQVTEKPRITVIYNGVKIHDNYEFQVTGTPSNAQPEYARTGPILLQNHRAPVRFRNIWVARQL